MRSYLVSFIALASLPAAAQKTARGNVIVDFVAAPPAPAWLASALAAVTERELSRFSRVALMDRDPADTARCPEREPTCLVKAYRNAGADVVLLGTASDERLTYEAYETWTGARAFHGDVHLNAANRSRAAAQIASLLRPIVQAGGLIDNKPISQDDKPQPAKLLGKGKGRKKGAGKVAPPPEAVEVQPRPRDPLGVPPANWVQLGFIVMILFMASPLLLVRSLVGKGRLAQQPVRPVSWLPITLMVTGLILAALAYVTPEAHDLAHALMFHETVRKLAGVLLPLAGGILWGSFALANLALVLPRLHGLERVRHEALRPLLLAWLWVSLQRALWLVGYLPFLAGAWFVARLSDVPSETNWMFVIPATGLMVYLWFFALVENLAIYLDEHLVHLPATSRNPWHHTMRRYFAGYVRRGGLDLDKVLRRTLFLPGKGDGIVVYGGGFTRSRVVVSAEIRELALGELPEETAAPERAVNYAALALGVITPDDKAPSGARGRRRVERAHAIRRDLAVHLTAERPAAPKLLGEAATTLGWVMPAPTDETVPLISNTSEDYHVVHELLTEHYARFERNLDEDEYDDTDPNQKDFLFGALLQEVGHILRYAGLFSTLRLALGLRMARLPRVALWAIKLASAFYTRFVSRYPAALADAYTALNSGRDHLIQYLDYVRTGTETNLTARADPALLFRTSRDILAATTAQAPTGIERQLFRATPRNRLMWLSQLFPSTVLEARERRLRALVATGVVLAIAAAVGVAVRNAMDYHPVYVERIHEMEKRIAEAKQGDEHGGSH